MENTWLYWALASAFFAALTAVFAKAGLQDIDSDFATFYPHIGYFGCLGGIFELCGQMAGRDRFFRAQLDVPDIVGFGHKAHLGWLNF